MAQQTKKPAEDYTGFLSPTQASLYGAGKEAVAATVTAKEKIAETAGKSAGITSAAAAKQAAAAEAAGKSVGGAYDTAATGVGGAYGAADTAFGKAAGGLEGAYAQAQKATAGRHRNALMAARQALAQAAMRGMQRGRTTAGNLGAAGTLGKQAAVTHGQMASQMAQEQANLTLGQAKDVGQLGIQQAQFGVQGAQQLGQLGIGGATAEAQAQQAAAGFTAAGMKEAQALALQADQASYDAVMAKAEELGLDFYMNEQQLANYQNKTNQAIADIAAVEDPAEAIVQAQAYMANLDLDNPADAVLFENIFKQAMAKVEGFGPNSGLWTPAQATALAQALGPQEALAVMAGMQSYIGGWSLGDSNLVVDQGMVNFMLERAIATGGIGNMGVLFTGPDNLIRWADSEEDVPAYFVDEWGQEHKKIWTKK